MCCFYDETVSVSEDHPHTQPLTPIPRSSSLAHFNHRTSGIMSRHSELEEVSMYRRRLSESSKAPIPSCDLLHWEQTRRLEKWKKGNQYCWFYH